MSVVAGMTLAGCALPALAAAEPNVDAAVAQLQDLGLTQLSSMPSGRVLPLRVFSDAAGLAAKGEAPGQGTIRLTYLGGDTFGSEFDSAFRFTVFFENGKAVKARMIKDGATMDGVRRP